MFAALILLLLIAIYNLAFGDPKDLTNNPINHWLRDMWDRRPLFMAVVNNCVMFGFMSLAAVEIIWRRRARAFPLGFFTCTALVFSGLYLWRFYFPFWFYALSDCPSQSCSNALIHMALYFILIPIFGALPFLYFGPNNSYLSKLLSRVEDLKIAALHSKNWTDTEWRLEQVREQEARYKENAESLLRNYIREKNQEFIFPSLMASIFFDEPFGKTNHNLKSAVKEQKLRYEIISGKEIPE